MTRLAPKFITFDCYGTLIYFEMAPVARPPLRRPGAGGADGRLRGRLLGLPLDEVLGPWKPYKDVVANALTAPARPTASLPRQRRRRGLRRGADLGPASGRRRGLAKVAKEFPW